MTCTNITGISNNNCGLVKGGITEVLIVPFSTINQYTYTDDNLDRITGYSATVLPVNYSSNPQTSEYTGTKSIRDYKLYNHSLSVTFSRMDEDKREELIKLESMELTIIFKDVTGTCWIMGQDIPCLLNSIEVGTGNSSGDNVYTVEFTSTEKQHLREIICPTSECFTSFTASEANRSVFEIPATTTFLWETIEAAVGNTVISSTPPVPLNPAVWNTNSLKLIEDRQVLLDLFSSLGATVTNLITTYISATDTTTILIDSSDTSYGTFQVDNTIFNRSSFFTIINFNAVLSAGINNPSSIIQVSDDNGILFSVPYGMPIVGIPGVLGTSNNSTIAASTLYPEGTTLTATLINVPCSVTDYTYTYQPAVAACPSSRTFNFIKGRRQKLTIPYITHGTPNTAPRFQSIKLNINGIVFTLYNERSQWHDSETQVENDIRNLLSQVTLDIDASSLGFVFTSTAMEITFLVNGNPNITNPFFRGESSGFNFPATYPNWEQSVVLELNTNAPTSSVVTHSTGANTMSGNNLTSITNVTGFELGYNPTNNNQSIDDVGILWNFDSTSTALYDEDTILTSESVGGVCNSADIISDLAKCYSGFTSTSDSSILALTLTVTPAQINSDNSFDITVNNVITTLNLPLPLTPNANSQFICMEINNIRGLRVIDYYFNTVLNQYVLYVSVASGSTFTGLTESNIGRSFALRSVNNIYRNSFTDTVNPYLDFSWQLPTVNVIPGQPAPSIQHLYPGVGDTSVGRWTTTNGLTTSARYTWNAANDEFNFFKQSTPDNLTKNYTFTLHEDYPNATNAVITASIPSGQVSLNHPGITALLTLAGSSLSAINFIAFTNNNGWTEVGEIDLSDPTLNVSFSELSEHTPTSWGTIDNINYNGVETTNPPAYSSTHPSCNPCCESNVAVTPSNITFTSAPTPDPVNFTISVSSTEPIDCNIEALTYSQISGPTIDSTQTNFILQSRGCNNGLWTWTGRVVFVSPPTSQVSLLLNFLNGELFPNNQLYNLTINHTF